MAVFKCKMCEASLEVTGSSSIVKCEYCGTYQSVTTDETGTIRTVIIESVGNPENLLKRGNMSIEERKWEDAEKYFDRVLDINVEEPRAYIGKLLAENRVQSLDELWEKMSWDTLKNMDNYKKAYRFSNGSLQQMFDEHYIKWAYRTACAKAASREISDLQEAVRLFTDIDGYEDSKERADLCREKIYNDAVRLMTESVYSMRYTAAKSEFESISGYRDADAKAEECAPKALEEAAEAAEERRRAAEERRREKEEERRRELQKREYQERMEQADKVRDTIVTLCVGVVTFIAMVAYYYFTGSY